MAWNNASLQKLFDEKGDRINSMSLNNGKYVLIGYETGIKLKDIKLETYNGVDVMVIHHRQKQSGTWVEWDSMVTTEFIEAIDIMTEECKQYCLDPFILK